MGMNLSCHMFSVFKNQTSPDTEADTARAEQVYWIADNATPATAGLATGKPVLGPWAGTQPLGQIGDFLQPQRLLREERGPGMRTPWKRSDPRPPAAPSPSPVTSRPFPGLALVSQGVRELARWALRGTGWPVTVSEPWLCGKPASSPHPGRGCRSSASCFLLACWSLGENKPRSLSAHPCAREILGMGVGVRVNQQESEEVVLALSATPYPHLEFLLSALVQIKTQQLQAFKISWGCRAGPAKGHLGLYW